MLVGTVATDDSCAAMLAKSGIIQSLIELLNGEFCIMSKKTNKQNSHNNNFSTPSDKEC